MAQNFPQLLKSLLSKIEWISLAVTVLGFSLWYIGNASSNQILMIGLSALAGVFFLKGYLPFSTGSPGEIAPEQKTKQSFTDMLVTILWKVIHIAGSVGVVGLLFYLLGLKGYQQMIMIGTATLFISSILTGFLILQRATLFEVFKGALVRALALLIIDGYILYINWPLQT